MNANSFKTGRTSTNGISGLPPSGSALLLDKLNGRRSTPDSEALASSDDEGDTPRAEATIAAPPQKPARRPSWLNDTSQSQAPIPPRKGSFASSTMSPTMSHPSPPVGDAAAAAAVAAGGWGSHVAPTGVMGRPHSGSTSSHWSTGIWNADKNGAPSRLNEVLPSPKSMTSPSSAGKKFIIDSSPTQPSLGRRDSGSNSQIPFSIPLHPTPKTYRSQSYSVGQLDPEIPIPIPSLPSASSFGARMRGPPHSGLQHRPSRPSMLSEMSNDLGKVKEVDDDEIDAAEERERERCRRASEAQTIENLTRENAYLRQQQYQQGHRLRQRASTGLGHGGSNGYGMQQTVPEEAAEYAVDELDESHDAIELAASRERQRRMSEVGAGIFGPSYTSPIENRNLENVKKAFWQSSLGFGSHGDGGQSRRHSFADAPTRQASIGSIGEQYSGRRESTSRTNQDSQEGLPSYADNAMLPNAGNNAYFLGGPTQAVPQPGYLSSAYGPAFQSPYGIQSPFGARPPSPHRNAYSMAQPRHTQKLYLVLFKFSRADVFYIQEGTGLSVKPGDLVIVEADRGTDLGTVAEENVEWAQAKEFKEHYSAEHYKWLMMYSQNAGGGAQDGTGAGLMAATNGLHGGAVGGMGPPNQQLVQEPGSGEIKPKLIKRVAQAHEIGSLRDKEANEAKAKRVCMQKVKEHQLNMEILDAEFQFDWKKLTFFYFADNYINFNSLVTDLFKIYKTRIWMSAINPASFASSTLGLQAPSGIGPGAVGVSRNVAASERRPGSQHEQLPQTQVQTPQPQQQQQQSVYTNPLNATRTFQGGFAPPLPEHDVVGPPAGMAFGPPPPPPPFPYGYGGFSSMSRPGIPAYGAAGVMPSVDPYGGSFLPPQYGMPSRFPLSQNGGVGQEQPVSPLNGQNEWVDSFQGLSMGSR